MLILKDGADLDEDNFVCTFSLKHFMVKMYLQIVK